MHANEREDDQPEQSSRRPRVSSITNLFEQHLQVADNLPFSSQGTGDPDACVTRLNLPAHMHLTRSVAILPPWGYPLLLCLMPAIELAPALPCSPHQPRLDPLSMAEWLARDAR